MEELLPRQEIVLGMVKPKPTDTLIDVGCGDGKLLLATGNCRKYGLDKFPQKIPGVEFCQADMDREKIPFADNFFDWVICTEVIEHLCKPDNLLSEINRVLKPNGILLLSTPNLASAANRWKIIRGVKPGNLDVSLKNPDTGHVRVYTVGMMNELFGMYGLRALEVAGAPPARKSNFARKIIETKVPSLASYIIFKAEKAK